jgi:hypothetical protein
MSQSDIYELLKTRRLMGDDKYYSSSDIHKMLIGKRLSITYGNVNNNIVGLRMFGYLEMKLESKKVKRITYPFAVYRLKKEYVV